MKEYIKSIYKDLPQEKRKELINYAVALKTRRTSEPAEAPLRSDRREPCPKH